MVRLTRYLVPALALGVVAAAVAQDRRDPPPAERRAPEKADAQLDAWVKTLTEKMTDPHDAIRESARAALVAVGPAAVPALKTLADGLDAAKATAVRKVIAAIEQGSPAARPGGRESAPADSVAKILGDLALSKDQKEEIDTILTVSRDKIDLVMGLLGADGIKPDKAREEIREIERDMLNSIKKLLTPEQTKKFEELMKRAGGEPRKPGERR